MKFTLDWLKDHLDTTASADQIAEALTTIGLEVESVEDTAKALKPFVVAHVVSAEPHPNSDHLKVCKVDAGTGAILSRLPPLAAPQPALPGGDVPPPASRNAPCPCGSGRKYKHCHGAAG